MQDKSNTIPKDWKIVRLIDIAKPIKDTAGDRKLETLSISAGIGFVNQANKFGKELSGKQYIHYTVIQRGDFSFNKGNSRRYPYGCIYMLRDRDIAAVPNAFYSFRIEGQYADYFEELFKFGYLNSQLKRLINTGVRDDGLFNLYEEDFYNCIIPLPPLDEQKKIAEILLMQDKVIALKEKLLGEKKRQKKCLLEQLLKSKEYVSLVSLCNFFCDGDWIESTDQSDCGIRLIQTGNIGVGQFIDKSNQKRFISQNTFKKLNCTEVVQGDILVSRLPEPAGRACIIPNLQTRAITAVDCTIIRFVNYSTIVFIGYTQTDFYQKQIDMLLAGSTRKRISRKELGKVKVPLLNESEQKEIAEHLSIADKEIELLAQDLESQKNLKKYLMQQLLTGKIRV